MTGAHRAGPAIPASAALLGVVAASTMAVPDVLTRLDSDRTGLATAGGGPAPARARAECGVLPPPEGAAGAGTTASLPGQSAITAADEHDLELRGFLVFLDPPKATASRALDRLARLGITVKILTGDNPAVAAKVCADLGLPAGRVATGADIDAAGDQLGQLLAETTVFARVSPEHKARIVREQRRTGVDVAFLGDGVNDAIALHAADVGISVESAPDVAKDAADVLLLEKDLDVLADGVMEGRRIFANTMKYVLMGTSSMLWIFHAGAPLFRSGWFVESLATQTLVIFAIRTRRIPFFRSHPSVPLLLAALGAVTVGALLPATPLARTLGFQPLPGLFFVALALMVTCYLALIEIGKRWFYRVAPAGPAIRHRTPAIDCSAAPPALLPPTTFLTVKLRSGIAGRTTGANRGDGVMQPSEDPAREPSSRAVIVDVDGLPVLFDALRGRGYTVVGPTVRDGAIVVAELASVAELPFGWGVETEAGRYRLRKRSDTAAFGHSAGPQSWKAVLHPPRAKLWSADRVTGAGETSTAETSTVEAGEAAAPPRYALLGVRPCDVRAVAILDQVLTGGRHADPVYRGRRDGAFIIAVECTEPGATCFCTSMGCGPGAESGFDLAMTELTDAGDHRFVVRAGTAAGADVLADLPSRAADEATVRHAVTAVAEAADRMGRTMPVQGLPQLLADSRDSPHWDDVASRCLTCGNCTMVCPTCFCTTTEDVTDLTGDHAERWRLWDSCFALDFSYLHGGSVRTSGQSRYRQWITHKLGTWHDQFGSSGCVGCGRCIAWCPVGIDIIQEVSALASLQDMTAADEDES